VARVIIITYIPTNPANARLAIGTWRCSIRIGSYYIFKKYGKNKINNFKKMYEKEPLIREKIRKLELKEIQNFNLVKSY